MLWVLHKNGGYNPLGGLNKYLPRRGNPVERSQLCLALEKLE